MKIIFDHIIYLPPVTLSEKWKFSTDIFIDSYKFGKLSQLQGLRGLWASEKKIYATTKNNQKLKVLIRKEKKNK